MIRFFWKFRNFNLSVIILVMFFCIYKFNELKVFFDSERIIELIEVDQDIIDKSLDDQNLLLVGLSFKDTLSYQEALKIDSLTRNLSLHKNIATVKHALNEKAILNPLLPMPINLFDLSDNQTFNQSFNKLKIYSSNFISNDNKNLLIVITCKDLQSEDQKKNILSTVERKFKSVNYLSINITGQIKSEIYMQNEIIKELIIFSLLSALICSLVLWYFVRRFKIVLISLFANIVSIIFSFSLSNYLFGGIELVMVIIPAIIFIITISDFMHLLHIQKGMNNSYRIFRYQMRNVGVPVFLTSVTTAIGFLSFAFGSFEPLTRFGVITTFSIFICLFIIITLYAHIVNLRLYTTSFSINLVNTIINFIFKISSYRKIIACIFILLIAIAISSFKIDNFLTDELNPKSKLYKEINYFEENFGGIKPLTLTLDKSSDLDFEKIFDSLSINIDFILPDKKNYVIKSRMNDIGSLASSNLYSKIEKEFKQKNTNINIGGIGYLFDQISNELTLEVIYGLFIAISLIGLIFVFINRFNYKYLFVSLLPNIAPLVICVGIISFNDFYISLSNAFIFAIAFGLIVDDSIHIISAYSINRKRNKSPNEAIKYCQNRTYYAIVKTTIVIVVTLIPLLFSEFRSISQLATITILSAIIAIVFDLIYLPLLLTKYVK